MFKSYHLPFRRQQPRPEPTSYSLKHVASALSVVTDCKTDVVNASYACFRIAPTLIVKLRVSGRLPHAITAVCSVTRDGVPLFESAPMTVPTSTPDCATGLLVGVVYRRAVMLLPLPPTMDSVTCSSYEWFVTSQWSPVRLARFAAILYVHTYNNAYSSVACDPCSIGCVSVVFSAKTRTTKLTIDYKPSGIQITTPLVDRFFTYPGNVCLNLTTSTFQWSGVSSSADLTLLCRKLWQLIVVLL